MTTKEQLQQLVYQLTGEELNELLSILAQRLGARDDSAPWSSTAIRERRELALMSGSDFNRMPRVELATLAEQQGVTPIADVERLLGDFWPDDEEDFDDVLREWRDEG